MPLQRSVISWPLTGGIDTKTSPLMIQPGSHIALDNVRQERTNEWRARNGTSQAAIDSPFNGNPALVAAPAGDNGAVAIGPPVEDQSAIKTYNNQAATAGRWGGPSMTGNSDAGPQMAWSRSTFFSSQPASASGVQQNMLSGATNGTSSVVIDNQSLVMRKPSEQIGADNLRNTINTPFQGITLRARIVWSPAASRFVRITALNDGRVVYEVFGSDGNVTVSATNFGTDGHLTIPHLDAISYGGSATITVVYRMAAAGQFKIVEYNPATNTIVSNVAKVVNCDNCLVLLPDPDASGIRFVALSSGTPTVVVLRLDSTGVTQTTDNVDVLAATQIAGSAYQSGASWMILYQTATGIWGAKKFTGVVGAPVRRYEDLRITLHSNAWRQSANNIMYYMIGYHTSSAADPQHSYFVVQQSYGFSSAFINARGTPIAKMLPLDAGPALSLPATLPQVSSADGITFEVPLIRITRSSTSGVAVAAGIRTDRYSADLFRGVMISATNLRTINQGAPQTVGNATLVPGGSTYEVSEGVIISSLGMNTIPPAPTLVPAVGAGSLTLLQTYQYLTVVVCINDAGEEWRSPPSIPATVTLTGGQNQVAVTPKIATELEGNRLVSAEVYRTKGNGSIFQKLINNDANTSAGLAGFIGAWTFTDQVSDVQLNSADFLYSSGIPPTALTPAFSHLASYGQRAWGVHRDYRQQLWFTRKFVRGKSPEFVDAFQFPFIDEEGDLTNIAQLDDKLIVFKASAIYFVQGDGPDEAGGGSFNVATRVDSDVGSIVGSPVVSTGQEVYFVSSRGIYMIDRSLQVQFIGAAVDQYLNQPLVQTRETVIGAVFSPATNEVRFQTTNYRLVYDRLRGIWYRDTGAGMQNVVSTCMVGSKQALFKSDGTMWLEGDETVTQDNGVSFTPSVRSAWVRPAGTDGRLRLYMARIIMTRTAGGATVTPTLRIYYDNDNSTFEFFTPSAIAGATLLRNGSAQPRRHRCSAFSLEFLFATNDDTLRLDAWGAEVGMRPGAFRNNSGTAERWT